MTRYCYRLSGYRTVRRVEVAVTVERVTAAFDPRAAEAWLRKALHMLRAVVDGELEWFAFTAVDDEGFIVPLAKGT